MDNWTSVSPYPEAAPHAIIGADGSLTHVSNGRRNCFGRWIREYESVLSGQSYKFTVDCAPDGLRDEFSRLHVILTWKDRDGAAIQRDYVDRAKTHAGYQFKRSLPAPEGAESVAAELCFKWSDTGKVTWRDAEFNAAKAAPRRIIKVASAYTALPGGKDENLTAVLNAIDHAAESNPDIICLGETQLTVGSPFFESAVVAGGSETSRIAEKAKLYGAYIVIGLSLKEDGMCRNSAVLFDRGGNITGIYRKIHLPLAEAESGYTPGDEFGVYETDFGKIGLMICWDQNYPELSRHLADLGAKILFNPTFGNNPLQARTRAFDNGVFFVVSGTYRDAEPCYIVDPFGEYVAICESGGRHRLGYCCANVDLDKQYKTIWHSVGNCYGEHKPVNRNERRSDIL